MKYMFFLFVGIILGAVVAIPGFKYWAETARIDYEPNGIEYLALFKLASTNIKSNRFNCEGMENQTVGAVLEYIFKSNNIYYLNKISEGCDGNACQIAHSNCASWQMDGCGSTMLMFNLTNDNNIDIESLQCLQMP